MPKLLIRAAELRSFQGIRKEALTFHRIRLACSPSPSLFEAMGWDELPEYIPRGPLDGEVLATNLVLTPQGELAKHELQLTCDDVSDFTFSRCKEDDETTRLEIRFVVRTSQEGAAGLLENFMRTAGGAPCDLRFNVEEQATLFDKAEDKPEPVYALKDEDGEVVRTFATQAELDQAAKGVTEPEPAGPALASVRTITRRTPHVGAVGKRDKGTATLSQSLAAAEKATKAGVQ